MHFNRRNANQIVAKSLGAIIKLWLNKTVCLETIRILDRHLT